MRPAQIKRAGRRSRRAAAHFTKEFCSRVRLHGHGEVFASQCPVPRNAGVYGWYFRKPPRAVPTKGCVRDDSGAVLLYVGISPKKPPRTGPRSRENLYRRIRYHFRGNAAGSTLRLSLGCLLARELGIELRRVGSGGRKTFRFEGERRLSEWMRKNAFVRWLSTKRPWHAEEDLISVLSLPLNLAGNQTHPFHKKLSALRRLHARRAAALPVVRK